MNEQLEKLVSKVKEGSKYQNIHQQFIENIATIEQKKGRSWKDTVKAVRNKLHQVGSAYQPQEINYDQLLSELKSLSHDLQSPEAKRFLIQTMSLHTSTRERLPILEQFYQDALADFKALESLLDVACGLNPLALAWMPINQSTRIRVCDIYVDQIEFLNEFFLHFELNGKAYYCDLTQQPPQEKFQLGLILKTIPCLEQIDKNIGKRILQELNCENLLVSFPAQSLTGRNKGMREFYSVHFQSLVAETQWNVTRFSYPNEQVFLLQK
ncbi:MAG TPA: hypothetical protein VK856_02200 [Anaerolineaceae bacterium]|nr:hypothetical protein [Anaerolineaceae bacterium]